MDLDSENKLQKKEVEVDNMSITLSSYFENLIRKISESF